MRDFKDIALSINEAELSEEEFMENIEKEFYKHFPNGIFQANNKPGVLGSPMISISAGLIGDRKDWLMGYFDNDPMKQSFTMFKKDDGTYELEGLQTNLYIEPAEDSYFAMDKVKTGFRNAKKITLKKAEDKFKKYFKKLATLVKDNKDNIYGSDRFPSKYLDVK